MAAVSAETRDALATMAAGRAATISDQPLASDLDERSAALVRIATLIALDAPPASYAREVANATDAGASAEDILGVLQAVARQVGAPRTVSAAAEIMLALGLSLPDQPDLSNGG